MSSTVKTSQGGEPTRTPEDIEVAKAAWRLLLRGKTEEEGELVLARIIASCEAFDGDDEQAVQITLDSVSRRNPWRPLPPLDTPLRHMSLPISL